MGSNLLKGHRVLFGGNKNVLEEKELVLVVVQHHRSTKYYSLLTVNFILCEFLL